MAPKKEKKAPDDDAGNKAAKGDISAVLGTLKYAKAQVEKGNLDANFKRKADMLEYYNQLPRFHSDKADIIQKFQKDKTGSWWQEFKTAKISTTSVSTDIKKGYGSRPAVEQVCCPKYNQHLLVQQLDAQV